MEFYRFIMSSFWIFMGFIIILYMILNTIISCVTNIVLAIILFKTNDNELKNKILDKLKFQNNNNNGEE